MEVIEKNKKKYELPQNNNFSTLLAQLKDISPNAFNPTPGNTPHHLVQKKLKRLRK